jgi:hypothetical protein
MRDASKRHILVISFLYLVTLFTKQGSRLS